MTEAVRIGALRTRLTLQAPVDAPDDTGAFARSWTPVAQLWAQVVPQDGQQRFAGDAVEVAITHHVFLRRRADVANGMRFVLGDRALLIRSVMDADEHRRALLCRCEEIAP